MFGRAPELEIHNRLLHPGVQAEPAGRRVALTFDDGPDRWTDGILNILAGHGAKATFFVVGANLDGNPYGDHEVGNHTWSHPNLETLTNDGVVRELADCSAAILDATGRAPYFYRAPFLNDTAAAKLAGLTLGMVSVGCDVVAGDWRIEEWREITNNVTRGVQAGGRIVLLHDGVPNDRVGDRRPTVKAVKAIVPWLQDHGYQLVTVSELLGRVDVPEPHREESAARPAT